MAAVAAIQLKMAAIETYRLLILGSSALHCPLLIFGFAIPVLPALSGRYAARHP
ncbi:hypothetical protein EV291_10846 [Rhizobium sp. BK068]|nr:hypothetical protein EV291_10846 [Rhizobium sp. BK068]